jgi:hypothetical protein
MDVMDELDDTQQFNPTNSTERKFALFYELDLLGNFGNPFVVHFIEAEETLTTQLNLSITVQIPFAT